MKTLFSTQIIPFVLFSIVLFNSSSVAQQETTFMIPKVVLETENDSIKIRLLDSICASLGRFHAEEVLFYRKYICKLATKNNFYRIQFIFSIKTVDAFIYTHQPDSAIAFGLKTLAWAETQRNRLEEKLFAWLYNDIGYAYKQIKDYPTSLMYYFKALKIKERFNATSLHNTYNNIGMVYMDFKKYKKALKYYEKSLALKRKNKNISGISKSLTNIGALYLNIKHYKKANEYYQQVLAMELADKDTVGILNAWVNIGVLAYKQQQYDTAIAHYRKVLSLRIQQGNPTLISQVTLDIADMHIHAHQFPEALHYLQQAETTIKSHQLDIHAFNVYKIYSDYYSLTNNSEKASYYYLKYQAIADSIEQEQNANFITELETRYETEKKEREIILLKQKNKISELELASIQRERKWMLGLGTLMALIIGILIWLYRYRIKTNQELATLNSTKDKLFTIIGHDLKNPLIGFRSITQSLSNNIDTMDKSSISYFIQKLEKSSNQLYLLIQNLLQWAINQSGQLSNTPQPFALEQLVTDVFNLFRINAEREGIQLKNDIPTNSLVYADLKITQTILRNLVDNAIKFTSKGGEVCISAEQKEQEIIVSVNDTGMGMSQEEQNNLFKTNTITAFDHNNPQKGTGIGLMLCKELVEQLGKKISVKSQPNKGTTFSFPLKQSTNV